eukprot:scaffold1184_cov132-Cylindrotheca_fusiformis.AAC.102
MVRGNWQRRVELNESRRNEAKQRKQRTEEKKVYKQKAQSLLGVLDKYQDIFWQQAHKSWEIHLWIDCLPSDQIPIEDPWSDEVDVKPSKRRNRAASIESENSGKNGKKKSGGGKKKHPRSKEIVDDSQEEQSIFVPRLCRSSFFTGECKNKISGKKGRCPSTHYGNESKTLAQILNENCDDKSEAAKVLASSEASLPDPQIEEDAGDAESMEMLYYISIPGDPQKLEADSDSCSEYIAGILTKKSCSIGSIVYLAFNGTLLFDRYGAGFLLSETDLFNCLSMGKKGGRLPDSSSNLARLLPGSVLEYVLTFLTEHEITNMSSVCKSWNTEIGKDSGNLWRHFLERRGWPVSPSKEVSYHDAFLSHYSTVRDLKAVHYGMMDILTKKSISSNDCFSRSYDASKDVPQFPDSCAGIAVWSQNQLLAAYAFECTLRLVTTTSRSGKDGDKICRELVCQNIDPYRNTRKKSCVLLDLALDDAQICCLCKVATEGSTSEIPLLLSMSRDDFLVSDVTEDDDVIDVVDVKQAVLDFFMDFDGLDDAQHRDFLSFISNDGNLDDVEVFVSPSLTACGNGLFLFQATWSFPFFEYDETQVSHRLFFYSVNASAIVHMQKVHTEHSAWHENMVVTSSVTKDESGCYGCLFAASSPVSMSLVVGTIHQNSGIRTSDTTKGSVPEGYSLCEREERPIAICGSTIIVADASVQDNEGGEEGDDDEEEDNKHYHSQLLFHACAVEDDMRLSCDTMVVAGNCEVYRIIPYREEHILVLCQNHPEPVDAIDGQWFGPSNSRENSLYGIIVHIPSRTEIYRVCLMDNDASMMDDCRVHLCMVAEGGTVAAGIWWKGIVMTGEEVRRIQYDPVEKENTPSKSKKKKKKTPKKGGKKDGFARGMSLRG